MKPTHKVYGDIARRTGSEEGNDWLGIFYATLMGIAVALITLNMLFGAQMDYWIASFF